MPSAAIFSPTRYAPHYRRRAVLDQVIRGDEVHVQSEPVQEAERSSARPMMTKGLRDDDRISKPRQLRSGDFTRRRIAAMTYLVTGGAGFIGSYVVRQLLEEGDRVIAFDRQFGDTFERVLRDLAGDVERVVGDVTDHAHLLRVCQAGEISRIIHLAGELHARSAENPYACIQSNVIGTHHVLETGRLLSLERVVTASSAAIFGNPRNHPPGPIANDAHLHAADVYEASKIFGETEGRFYAERFGVDNVALRVGLAYGYGCRIGWAARLVHELVERPLRGEPGRVPWRDSMINWTYAPDAADAFVRASRVMSTGTFAYNLRGDPRSMMDTVEVARSLIPDADIDAETGEHDWAQDFDDSLLRTETGYEARWTIEDGLADIIRLLRAE
jgi:nucleoside-diphosphate-sugar epimerase